MTGRAVRRRLALLLGVLVLIGAPLGWWLLTPQDRTSTTGIDVVRGEPGSATLEVDYTAGAPGCADPGGVAAKETSGEVRLTAHTITRQVRPFRSVLCPAIGLWAHDRVTLAQPLGERRVIDTTRAANGGAELVIVQPPCPTPGLPPQPGKVCPSG